jgi:cystathionine beta-lyase/cystathionine gamma-synthase
MSFDESKDSTPSVCHSLSKREDGTYNYNRSGHPMERLVKEEIAKLHGVHSNNVAMANSGIDAIAIVLHGIMVTNQFKHLNIYYANELYCDSPRYIKYFDRIYGISNIQKFDVLNSRELIDEFKKKRNKDNVVFVESCSNPNGHVFDYSIIKELRKTSRNLWVVVDNTWTPVPCHNPLDYDVDIMVSSTSKHFSAGTCIGGFVISQNKTFARNLADYNRINGKHISLPYCELIESALPYMADRISTTYTKTKKVLNAVNTVLKSGERRILLNVQHPYLEDHDSHDLFAKYFKFGASTFTMEVGLDKKTAITWMKSFTSTSFKTSFGSADSKFDNWPTRLTDKTTLVRLTIGYDTNEDILIEELKRKLC